jgi:hypothetical protein
MTPTRKIGGERLDEARTPRKPPEQTDARSLGVACGVGLVPDVGVLRVGCDLVVHDRLAAWR